MRNVFILSFAANLALAVYTLWAGPDKVAIHFGSGGQPDNWASSIGSALFTTGINTLLFLCFLFFARIIRRWPAKYISLPNKNYWLREENRKRAEALLAGQMYYFGTAIFLFLFIAGVLVLHANLSNPVRLREDVFLVFFVLFMGFTLVWTINFLRAFRIPDETFHRVASPP